MGKTDPSHSRKVDSRNGKNVPKNNLPAYGDPFIEYVDAGLSEALMQAAAAEPLLFGRIEHGCLVGFSGGPDSTALLVALGELRVKRGFKLFACHVNHHLRQSESDTDEEFCRQLASKLDLPIFVRHLKTSSAHLSEADLRKARYEMLSHAAREAGAGFIALGHTLDDQVETILFRLLRGTGPSGLTGMRASRPHQAEFFLLRPLLSICRSDCLAYLSRAGHTYRQDSSNDDLVYARNYLRQVVLPPVKERFPGFEERVEQLRELLLEDERLLDSLADQALADLTGQPGFTGESWALERLNPLPPSLKRRVIAKQLSACNVEVTFERVKRILEISEAGGALSLNADWDVRVSGGRLAWIRKLSPAEDTSARVDTVFEVRIPGLTLAPSLGKALRVESSISNDRPLNFPDSKAPVALVDLSQAKLPIQIRARRPGDLIKPFGMNELVRLKKFLHNKKSSGDTDLKAVPVIADQEEVLWVPGWGLSNKIRVTGQPTHRLTWLDIAPDEVGVC